jgi:hypothetical protein
LLEKIEVENTLYVHNQAVFSLPIGRFVIRHVSDLKTLLLYFMNVVLHSKNGNFAQSMLERILEKFSDDDAVAWAAGFFAENISRTFEAFRFCQSTEILNCLSVMLTDLLNKNDVFKTSLEIVSFLVNHLGEMTPQKFGLVALPVAEFLRFFQLEMDVQREWATQLVCLMNSIYETKRPAAVNADDVFDCLASLFGGVTQEMFNGIVSRISEILTESAPAFVRLLQKGIEAGFATVPQVLSRVFGSNDEQPEIVKANFVSARLSYAIDGVEITRGLSEMQPFVSPALLARLIYRLLDMDYNFKLQLLLFPKILVCPLLVAPEFSTRVMAERIVYDLFPTVVPLRNSEMPELLLESEKYNFVDQAAVSAFRIDCTDADNFTHFMDEVGDFCRDICSDLPCGQHQLSSLFRIVRRGLTCFESIAQAVGHPLWQLFVAVGVSEWRGGCNLYESVRAIASLPHLMRDSMIRGDLAAFSAAVFPLSFKQETKLHAMIFLDIVFHFAVYLPLLKTETAFCETFRAFWDIPMADEDQGWIISQVGELGASVQIATSVSKLVDVFQCDCLPLSILPILVKASLAGPPLLPVLRTMMVLCGMLFAESGVAEVVLDLCAADLFNLLRPLLRGNGDAVKVCRDSLPSLCALFLSPSSFEYRQHLLEFIGELAVLDAEIRNDVMVTLLGEMPEIEDVQVVWDALALRLFCASLADDNEGMIGQCLEDAVLATAKGDTGSEFIGQIRGVLSEAQIKKHAVALRRLLDAFETQVTAQGTMPMKAAVTTTMLDDFRECLMVA